MRFKNQGFGAKERLASPKDFQREFFFGAGERQTPEWFNHSEIYENLNQGQNMDCVFEATTLHYAIKYYLKTGVRLVISHEVAWRLALEAEKMQDEEGFPLFSRKTGAYTNAGLIAIKALGGIQVMDENGDLILVEMVIYFYMDNHEINEEIYHGGSVISGVSSRMVVDISPGRYAPFFAVDKKSNKSDGHCIIKAGRQSQKYWATPQDKIYGRTKNIPAYVVPNSYGTDWGDEGEFFIDESLNEKTFRNIGSVFKFTNISQSEKRVDKPQLFKDVGRDSVYSEAIEKAHAAGAITGYGDGRFGPNDPLTRGQIALILDRLGLFDK